MKKIIIIAGIIVALGVIGAALYFFVFAKNLNDTIALPYISHQKPRIDPHLASAVPIADKLDEVVFDGIFNISSDASGITYEDGLGKFLGIDEYNTVTIRLKPTNKWHQSYNAVLKKKKMTVTEKESIEFVAKDLHFTLRRIEQLGSLSPDYILVSQAIEGFSFTGPNENNEIQLKFRDDRMWTESDIKEVLSFKILPHVTDLQQTEYKNGTGPYLAVGEYEDMLFFHKNPSGQAHLTKLILKPYIDNSTFSTELKNKNINVLLDIPFGSVSPILGDTSDYFYKSGISTVFFAIFHNTQRLTRGQRQSLRKLIDKQNILYRFFNVKTQQQRNIVDYKGNENNYEEYMNYSIFPSSSYYVEEKVVLPLTDYSGFPGEPLPDTVHIQTCLNYGFREELAGLVEILNDERLFGGKIKASAVQNEEIMAGNYDAILVPISGYRSNFLFDLYTIFLREPDLSTQKINLQTIDTPEGLEIDERSFAADKNFFRLDLSEQDEEYEDKQKLLEHLYGFMSTSEVGDKQMYAQLIDELDQEMALGTWLFSLPSLAYFNTQFDANSINLYGVTSQLSTAEHWQERKK